MSSPPSPSPAAKPKGRVRCFLDSIPDFVKVLAAVLVGISGILASLAGIGQEVQKYPAEVSSLVATFHPPRQPGLRVVFVSNDEFLAKSDLSVLSDAGAQTDYLDTSQIASLPGLNPDLVIFGSGAEQPDPIDVSGSVRTFLEGDVKVMGIGSLGSVVLQELELFSPLAFRHAVGVQNSQVILTDKRYALGLLVGNSFNLYEEDSQSPATGFAIFDGGSLSLSGATGIAEVPGVEGCNGRSWPVVRQGNDLFWGYSLPATAMSPMGVQLFQNVVMGALRDAFQKPQQQLRLKEPGSYSGDAFGCRFSENEYRVQVAAVGAIEVAIASKSDISLSVTGPRSADTYAVHGISPKLLVPITTQAFNAGADWIITVAYKGPLDIRTRIDYTLRLGYPSDVASPGRTVLVTLLIALTCLFGLLCFVYLFRGRALAVPAGSQVRAIWRRLRA
jgi:hypothetical protein